jgi:hypothetical protein
LCSRFRVTCMAGCFLKFGFLLFLIMLKNHNFS